MLHSLDLSLGRTRRNRNSAAALDWSWGSSVRSGRGRGRSPRRGGGGGGGGDAGSSSSANRHATRRDVKRLSKLVADPRELARDEVRLADAVREAGSHSSGVDAIAVWMLDEEGGGRLVQPPGGWWSGDGVGGGAGPKADALARLEDAARKDYIPAAPVCPGVDMAGILWAESRDAASLKSTEKQDPSAVLVGHHPIRWRDIKSITEDPYSASGPRLRLMEEAGFTMAAGITFRYLHHQGMVVFLTSAEADEDKKGLTSVANSAYMHQAAQLIGATLSLAELRKASLAERLELKQKCFSIPEQSPSSIEEGKGGKVLEGDGSDGAVEADDRPSILGCAVPHQVVAWSRKLKGGSSQPPPSLSWQQSAWTVLGSFTGLLILSSLNLYYRFLSDDEYFLLIGPFGAMCTLMYGLSAAPASQPRNAVLGQAVAGAVSLAFTYVPESVLPVWLRTAVGPALAIGTMVKLGVVHPPAGAHSVLYASGKFDFAFYALVVFSTVVSVVPAMVVNNMSAKRQYPTYWGFGALGERAASSWRRLGGVGKQEAEDEPSPEDEKAKIKAKSIEVLDGSGGSNKGVQPTAHSTDNDEEADRGGSGSASTNSTSSQ